MQSPIRLYLFNGVRYPFADRRKFLKMILEPGIYEICYDQNHFIRIDHFKRLITYHIFDWIEKNNRTITNVVGGDPWWEHSLRFTVKPKQDINTIEELERGKKINLSFEFRICDDRIHIWKPHAISNEVIKEIINMEHSHQLRFHCYKLFITKETIKNLIEILDSMNLYFDYCADYDYCDRDQIVLKTIPKSKVRKLLDKI